MHSDLPLKDKDDDQLERYQFAEQIALGLVSSFANNNESIVLGINGSWGSGKSTLINYIVKEIEKNSKERKSDYIILNFNPWMFSGQKELQNIFLKELYLKFESQKDKLVKGSQKLAEFLNHLNWLKYVHSGAGELAKDAQTFLKGLSKEKDLSQLKKRVDDVLIKSKVKLYITIDDIDRLTPTEITEIFQLVKLNGSFANTVFLLAYDREVVLSALERQFGENGKKYLEKIVQVDYGLPKTPSYDIYRLLKSNLLASFNEPKHRDEIEKTLEELSNQNFILLFNSIRDIYRFTNSIKLRLPSIFEELNLSDFFAIEAIRIFNPTVYEFISNERDKLTSTGKKSNKYLVPHYKDDKDSKREFILKQKFSKYSSKLVLYLFDRNSNQYHSVENTDLIRAKRIANANYFDRYFHLKLSETDIPEELFQSFISQGTVESKVKVLTQINQEEKLFRFLDWTEKKCPGVTQHEIEDMIYASFQFSDTLKYKSERFEFMDFNFMTIQRFCSKMLGRLHSVKSRRISLEKHISDEHKKFSFSSLHTVNSLIEAKIMHDNDELYSDRLWYSIFNDTSSNDTFEAKLKAKLKKIVKLLFKKYLNDEDSLNGEELLYILPLLKKQHSEFYDREFKKLIANDEKMLEMLKLCISRSVVTSNGKVGYALPRKNLLPGLEIESIHSRISGMKKKHLPKEKKAVCGFFLKVYEDGFEEKNFYNFYTQELVTNW